VVGVAWFFFCGGLSVGFGDCCVSISYVFAVILAF